jgi:hypothetical protein
MSEGWKAAVDQFSITECAQTDLLNRQLDAALLAMARHLVVFYRVHGNPIRA